MVPAGLTNSLAYFLIGIERESYQRFNNMLQVNPIFQTVNDKNLPNFDA